MKNYFRRYFNPMYQGGGIPKFYKATEGEGGAPEIKELTDETDPENKALADDSEEVKSLKKISRQTKQFNTVLGTKAPKAEVDEALYQIKALQAEIKTMKDADILKAMEKINEANTKIWQQIAEMQEEKAASKEAGNAGKKSGLNFNRKDVEDFVKTTFKD